VPTKTIFTTTNIRRSDVVNPDYATWYVRDQTVLGGFFSTVTEEVLTHIMSMPTTHAAWLILERMYASRSCARVIQICSQLTSAKKKGLHVANYLYNMKKLADMLAAIGRPLHDKEVISYVLAGLGPNYNVLAPPSASRMTSRLMRSTPSYWRRSTAMKSKKPTTPSATAPRPTSSAATMGSAAARGHMAATLVDKVVAMVVVAVDKATVEAMKMAVV
jgi:hypothetical protein